MRRPRALIVRVIAAAACWSLAGAAALADDWRPLAALPAAAQGVWQSDGYGHLLVVGDAGVRLFDVAGAFCAPDPSGPTGPDDSFQIGRIDGNRLTLAPASDQTHYRFHRIDGLPDACLAQRSWPRADVAALVAATMDALYPGFSARRIDRARFDQAMADAGTAADDATLFAALTGALAMLDDPHVSLTATINGEEQSWEGGEAPTLRAVRADPRWGADPDLRERAWLQQDRADLTALLDGGGHLVANRRILWGRIGDIGYLDILTMGAFDAAAEPDSTAALDAVLDHAFAELADTRAMIVDVSNNRGGFDAVSLHLAGRFAAQPAVAFAKRGWGAEAAWQRFTVTPSARIRYTRPVVLLTSDITVSAGETFTLAMRALPNVGHMGARTRGALSDQLTRVLPNGWTLTLPAEEYRDAGGAAPEGHGIAPEQAVAPFVPSHAAAVAALARSLQR